MARTRRDDDVAEKWALPARQARSRATRERILDAAERAFAESGYERTRIADIAEMAGCSVGAVYFRFKDKDALFFAIAESFALQSRARFKELLGGSAASDPAELVRAFVLRSADNFRAHRGLFRAIVERGFGHAPAMDAMLGLREDVIALLDRAIQRREKQDPEVSVAIRVISQMVYGFLLTGVINRRAPTRIDDPSAINALAEAAVAYLKSVQNP